MPDKSIIFPPQIGFDQTARHVHLAFGRPFNALSCAVLNGGFQAVDHIVNLKVPKAACTDEEPAMTLNRYCLQQGWQGTAAGMMTAASMKSLRIRQRRMEGVDVMALVTTGLSNARRAGDPAEWRTLQPVCLDHDTINIILISTARFTPSAMVEAIMIATEAKAAALQNAAIKSAVSHAIATGTGTDAIIMACPEAGQPRIEFCGKHVLMGEVIGQLVIEAVTDSIRWELAAT
ncbi:adenosylcobinamide amidohydrolase [Methylobacter marinus]|uniref:adenosylcobinamide amidohydrolase n=1 Tax=Methylobacter marinus TaxID=34058 RepID=UPI00037DA9C8|nr:adenosylcobinamide amidohydrolase [Methylobacter marinus]